MCEKLCGSFREHATIMLNFEKKGILPLIKEELKLKQDAGKWFICGKRILQKLVKSKNYSKVRDNCYYMGKYKGTTQSICNLKFNVPNKIPAVFCIGLNYDYYFIIKKLANRFEEKCMY